MKKVNYQVCFQVSSDAWDQVVYQVEGQILDQVCRAMVPVSNHVRNHVKDLTLLMFY